MATAVATTSLDLLQPFSMEKFNRLGRLNRIIQCHGSQEIEQAARIEQVVDSVAHVLIEYQMHDLLGVSLVHNHFDLNEGEIVRTGIESLRKNSNINGCMNDDLVEATSNEQVFFTETVSTSTSSAAAIPYMWSFDKETKKYFPTQFFDGTNVEMKERWMKVCQRDNISEFLRAYHEELTKHGLENDLGLFLQYQDLVEPNQDAQSFYEITNNETREQVLFVTPKEGVDALMKKLGHGCIRNTHWTIKQKADGTIDKAVGWCICGIDC